MKLSAPTVVLPQGYTVGRASCDWIQPSSNFWSELPSKEALPLHHKDKGAALLAEIYSKPKKGSLQEKLIANSHAGAGILT